MKTGRISNQDKYIIKGMYADKKSVAEIAKAVDRSEDSVSNYINGELDDIASSIAKAQIEAEETFYPATEDIIEETVKELKGAGLLSTDIEKLLDKVLKLACESRTSFTSAKKLYSACIQNMRAGEFMIKKTESGSSGIAIMTQSASTRLDDARKRKINVPRTARGNMFNPKTGKMI